MLKIKIDATAAAAQVRHPRRANTSPLLLVPIVTKFDFLKIQVAHFSAFFIFVLKKTIFDFVPRVASLVLYYIIQMLSIHVCCISSSRGCKSFDYTMMIIYIFTNTCARV